MSDTKKSIEVSLGEIQRQMRAPKNKKNDFGGYSYRNAEGILAAFKSLDIQGASLTMTDSLQEIAGQIFVTSTARLHIYNDTISAQGHAMHPLQKKGMDASQITGSASSYARKYALCGLFAIEDESQDPDARDNRQEMGQTPPPAPEATSEDIAAALDMLDGAETIDDLRRCFANLPAHVRKVPIVENKGKARAEQLKKTPPADDLAGDGIPDFDKDTTK